MERFEASRKFEHIGYDIRGPVLDEAERMERQGISVIKLNTGNPAPFGFNTEPKVMDSLIRHAPDAQGYSNSKGIEQAKEAIANYCTAKGIPNVGDDIYTGNGVSELIVMSMQGLLNPGDEMLVPSPDYPLWTAAVTLAGGKPVHYICDERSDWQPDISDIRKKVSPRTKGIVVINPNNPTGALYETALLNQIAELAREQGLLIFADEIYDRLVMDGLKHVALASLAPDLPVITFNGLSKSHLIAGFRCGWMCISGEKQNAKGYIEALNMLASMRLCSNVLSQYVIKEALQDLSICEQMVAPGGRIYEQRECIYTAIQKIDGLSAVKPKAAFYIFPKIDIKKFNITNDEQFVLDFLREHKILLVHGGGFHWEQPDHFRIVYLPEVRQLQHVAQEMEAFLSKYKQN